YETTRRVPQSLEDFARAVELVPDSCPFRIRLGEALFRNNKADQALLHFKEAIRLSPRDERGLLGTARCLRLLARPAEAGELLDALLREHPECAEGWAEKSQLASDQGSAIEALRCARQAAELAPGDTTVVYTLFRILQAQGKEDEAKVVHERWEE